MFKKYVALAGVGLVATSALLGTSAAHASASTSSAGGPVFVHGLRYLAHFDSRAVCDSHAQWAVDQVSKAGSGMTLLPSLGYSRTSAPTECYPIVNRDYPGYSGEWSYVVAYRSVTGKPLLSPVDVKVDPGQSHPPAVNPDHDSVYGYAHKVAFSTKTTSLQACNNKLNWSANAVLANPNAHLSYASKTCSTQDQLLPGYIGYEVDYLGTSENIGLAGDRAIQFDNPSMLASLGYNVR
ncbi:hypothetical protein [Allobranchiibius huperziae]|uniref:Secreted protein n=1 Tax=Allobranchiibius huperziae TaxID=1874116 RepID=A0A853DH67_9MICO|nr:hypothetical protein [Allobranchiibius huperziae]NYJ73545.1 hypothetical protein [Allobranchiibius huperziae]